MSGSESTDLNAEEEQQKLEATFANIEFGEFGSSCSKARTRSLGLTDKDELDTIIQEIQDQELKNLFTNQTECDFVKCDNTSSSSSTTKLDLPKFVSSVLDLLNNITTIDDSITQAILQVLCIQINNVENDHIESGKLCSFLNLTCKNICRLLTKSYDKTYEAMKNLVFRRLHKILGYFCIMTPGSGYSDMREEEKDSWKNILSKAPMENKDQNKFQLYFNEKISYILKTYDESDNFKRVPGFFRQSILTNFSNKSLTNDLSIKHEKKYLDLPLTSANNNNNNKKKKKRKNEKDQVVVDDRQARRDNCDCNCDCEEIIDEILEVPGPNQPQMIMESVHTIKFPDNIDLEEVQWKDIEFVLKWGGRVNLTYQKIKLSSPLYKNNKDLIRQGLISAKLLHLIPEPIRNLGLSENLESLEAIKENADNSKKMDVKVLLELFAEYAKEKFKKSTRQTETFLKTLLILSNDVLKKMGYIEDEIDVPKDPQVPANHNDTPLENVQQSNQSNQVTPTKKTNKRRKKNDEINQVTPDNNNNNNKRRKAEDSNRSKTNKNRINNNTTSKHLLPARVNKFNKYKNKNGSKKILQTLRVHKTIV